MSDDRNKMGKVSLNSLDEDDGNSRKIAVGPSFAPLSSLPASMAFEMRPKLDTHLQSTVRSKEAAAMQMPSTLKAGPFDAAPVLPEFHPLERTAVFVPDSTASDISRRLSEILRERSIETAYEADKAKIKCYSADGVDFRVRLYQGRGNFSHGIIVEVQRRFGASHAFQSDVQAILDAAEGKKPVPPPPGLGSLPFVSNSEDDYKPNPSSSLKMVAKMLSHPGYDSHYLALQTLSSLTDGNKIGNATARQVSSDLLVAGGDVGNKVLKHILDFKENDEDMFKLRAMAWTILGNAVQSVRGDVSLVVREQLVPLLIKELDRADISPFCATQAARCVECFLPEAQNMNGLYDALSKALKVGTERHAGLKKQAEDCLKMM